jgi:hypothetical protein
LFALSMMPLGDADKVVASRKRSESSDEIMAS